MNHLDRLEPGADCGEPHNVREEHGDGLEELAKLNNVFPRPEICLKK